MQVRVFESPDMATGLKMIRKELGPDALILSTRTVRNGKLGLLGKPVLEITAAIDKDFNDVGGKNKQEPTPLDTPNDQRNSEYPSFAHAIDNPVEQFLHSEEKNLHPEIQPDKEETKNNELQSEVTELKKLVLNLSGQISKLHNEENKDQDLETPQPAVQIKDTTFSAKIQSSTLHGDHILSMLIEKGINIETSRTITGFLRESLTEKELANTELVKQTLVGIIQSLIEVHPVDLSTNDERRRIAFIGPTGVGKTTTLAKIAASFLSKNPGKNDSIALITIDTYRIAAVEQLKVYGEIMHIPVEVVLTPEQLIESFERFSDKEIILIDTAGRSPHDMFSITELHSFFPEDLQIEKHLVLSASTREEELLATIEKFEELDIANTIITKIDECTNLGILLNVQIQNPNPLSWITNGQRVPEDLIEINPQILSDIILSSKEGSLNE